MYLKDDYLAKWLAFFLFLKGMIFRFLSKRVENVNE